MARRMIKIDGLKMSEKIQSEDCVRRIAEAIGSDPDNIMWDDQPAIIIDQDGNLLDGHHRVSACVSCGLPEWPAIIVDRAEWDRQPNHEVARRWACEIAEDYVTWGAQ